MLVNAPAAFNTANKVNKDYAMCKNCLVKSSPWATPRTWKTTCKHPHPDLLIEKAANTNVVSQLAVVNTMFKAKFPFLLPSILPSICVAVHKLTDS